MLGWLLRDGEVVAALEIADTFGQRLRGLLGRDGIDGAMVFANTRSIHSLGMRFPIDVAFCDAEMEVIDVVTMKPNRIALPRRRAKAVVEAEAGAFDRWGVKPGVRLEIKT